MKIVFLGTAGYHPTERRHTACLLLPESGAVLDAGSAAFRLRRHVTGPQLDFFLTHGHLDHVIGLTYLWDLFYGGTVENVRVWARAEVLRALDEHLFYTPLFPVKPPMEFRPLEGPVALSDGGRLTYFPLEHPGGALGYRIDWPGRSMAYVTDTTADPAAAYVEAIRGVDLLVHECYFADGWEDRARQTGHSWTTAVAETARAAGARRLALVHTNPLADADDPVDLAVARRIFPATDVARDGWELEF